MLAWFAGICVLVEEQSVLEAVSSKDWAFLYSLRLKEVSVQSHRTAWRTCCTFLLIAGSVNKVKQMKKESDQSGLALFLQYIERYRDAIKFNPFSSTAVSST